MQALFSLNGRGPGASAVRRPRPGEEPAAQPAALRRPGRSPQVGSPGSRTPAPPARGPHGAHGAAPHLPAPALSVPAFLPAASAAPCRGRAGCRGPEAAGTRARAAEAPRVPPGLARAERAGPGSRSLSAPRRRRRVPCAPDPGPAGPGLPGRAWMPPPGRRDAALLGETG